LNKEDLLRPTLTEYRQFPALYSSTGFFLSAFFGGPVGAVLFGLCNSRRLARLSNDLPVFITCGLVAFLVMYLFEGSGVLAALGYALGTGPRRTSEIALRALALGCFGAIYFVHRNYYRAAKVSGAASLSAWIPGIAAVALGALANHAFIASILAHH